MTVSPGFFAPDPSLSPYSKADRCWLWHGQPIGYVAAGNLDDRASPAVVLIHGFGASVGHWRKNIPALARASRTYAIDLLGFGASAKPLPDREVSYTFETWGAQVADFCREVVGTPAVLVGNSIGAMVAMQAAIVSPDLAKRVLAIDCSLRLLHDRKRYVLPWYRQVGASILQALLGNRAIASLFFQQLRQPQAIRRILHQAYVQPQAISDELVEILLHPARDPNAVAVFQAFVRYSQGPTPEELLARLPCEAILLWGERDPWEPIELGRALQRFPCVKEFIPIPKAGHCPQDEVPEVINPLLLAWIQA